MNKMMPTDRERWTTFLDHLNRIYFAKCHVQERLPELRADGHFADLSHAADQSLNIIRQQIGRLDTLFEALGISADMTHCDGMVAGIEDSFGHIHRTDTDQQMRDISVWYYLKNVDDLISASSNIIHVLVQQIVDPKLGRLIKRSIQDMTNTSALFLKVYQAVGA